MPAEADEGGAASTEGRATRWVGATKEARDAIKWLATAIGAAAAVAFGAGPVLASTTLDIAKWEWWRTALYIASAVVAAAGVAYIVWSLLRALVPQPVTLDNVTPTMKAELDASQALYYPGDITTFDEFVNRFSAYRDAAAGFRYDAALASGPERGELNKLAEQSIANLKTLREAENIILEKAGFEVTRGALLALKWPLLRGVCIAVLAVAIFQLVVSGPTDSPGEDAGGKPALLVRSDNRASTNLWDRLGLSACEQDPGEVPVRVLGGSGTDAAPYSVQTQAAGTCPVVAFTVTNDVALVATSPTSP